MLLGDKKERLVLSIVCDSVCPLKKSSSFDFEVPYMDSHGKKPTHIFVLAELPTFLELCPFLKTRMKFCMQDIAKSI